MLLKNQMCIIKCFHVCFSMIKLVENFCPTIFFRIFHRFFFRLHFVKILSLYILYATPFLCLPKNGSGKFSYRKICRLNAIKSRRRSNKSVLIIYTLCTYTGVMLTKREQMLGIAEDFDVITRPRRR